MSTMVEKVARAICAAADDDWDWSAFYIVDAKDTAETGREIYRAMARAAIEAMKEPTKAMWDAGTAAIEEARDFSTDSIIGSYECTNPSDQAIPCFQAMIEAALKEEGQ